VYIDWSIKFYREEFVKRASNLLEPLWNFLLLFLFRVACEQKRGVNG
jgi:hypothetical protein